MAQAKSQLLNSFYIMHGCTYVNPDIIAQNDFGNWNSTDAVIKASNKAKAIREIA